MSGKTNDAKPKPADLATEGGDSSPPSVGDTVEARERPPLIEADPVEEAVEVLAEVLPSGDRERARRIVQTFLAWSGPLPPPGELREYGEVAPGAIEAIVADFQRRSELAAETERQQNNFTSREFDILEREQTLRERESAADIDTRTWVLRAGAAFTIIMVLGALYTLMNAPVNSDWSRVALVGFFFLPLLIFGVAVLLRGRYSPSEGEVMMKTLPHVTDAHRRGPKKQLREGPKSPQLPDSM